VEIFGLVPGQADADAAKNAVARIGIAFAVRIRNADMEMADAGSALGNAFPWARLLREGPFSFRLSGLAENQAEAAGAYQLARKVLDQRLSLRRGMLFWDELRNEAERKALRLGFTGARIVRRNGMTLLEGGPWPDAGKRQAWLAGIRDDYGEEAARIFADAREGETEPEFLPGPELPPVTIIPRVAVVPPPPESDPEPARSEQSASGDPDAKTRISAAPSQSAMEGVRVDQVLDSGFRDQHDRFHPVGNYIQSNLRLAKTWPGGIVLQRGREVIFVNVGETVMPSPPD
jgi:hypothetical protein